MPYEQGSKVPPNRAMAYHSLSSLIPNAADLLALPVEELAGVLLVHLNSLEGVSGNSINQNGGISHHNFFSSLKSTNEYGEKQPQVLSALMEAWAWLISAGLFVEKAGSSGGWYFVSRRGKQITARTDFTSYRSAGMLPKEQIHPLIAAKVYPAFLRGEYDTAIFQAFREIEVSVRQAANLSQNLVGDALMRTAFGPPSGRLCDNQLPPGEQQAMMHLFAGAFGVYRNSTAHRYVPTKPAEAAEVIMFASALLRIVVP